MPAAVGGQGEALVHRAVRRAVGDQRGVAARVPCGDDAILAGEDEQRLGAPRYDEIGRGIVDDPARCTTRGAAARGNRDDQGALRAGRVVQGRCAGMVVAQPEHARRPERHAPRILETGIDTRRPEPGRVGHEPSFEVFSRGDARRRVIGTRREHGREPRDRDPPTSRRRHATFHRTPPVMWSPLISEGADRANLVPTSDEAGRSVLGLCASLVRFSTRFESAFRLTPGLRPGSVEALVARKRDADAVAFHEEHVELIGARQRAAARAYDGESPRVPVPFGEHAARGHVAHLFSGTLRLEPVAALEAEGLVGLAPPVGGDSVGKRDTGDDGQGDAEEDERDQGIRRGSEQQIDRVHAATLAYGGREHNRAAWTYRTSSSGWPRRWTWPVS